MAGQDVRGRFVWYDLMTTDPEQAKRFYGDVVGWEIESWQGGPMPYDMWKADHGAIGGVMELPREARDMGAPPHWLCYIGTPDVDATCQQAKSLGGKVVKEPMDIPEVGRFAVLTDPQGAYFCAFTPGGDMPGLEGWPRRGDFSWHELMTTDYQAAFQFYSELFGWETTSEMDMGEMGKYHMYGLKGVPFGGMMKQPPGMNTPPFWLFYAMVDNADAATDRARNAGATVLNGPMEVPGGDRVAVLQDPQGAGFGVHSLA